MRGVVSTTGLRSARKESVQSGRRAALLAAACVLWAFGASAQELRVGDPQEDLLRTLEVAGLREPGLWSVRPLRLPPERLGPVRRTGPFTVVIDHPEQRVTFNSALPWGQNDGAIWQGRGAAGAVRLGGMLRAGPFTVQLRPELVYAQNRSFTLTPVENPTFTAYTNPWNRTMGVPGIDMPQRFGPDGWADLRWGQSGAWLTLGGFTVGASHAEQWWGPAQRNPLVLSNHASGFPHAFAGTSRPVDVRIGRVEARVLWGRLEGSEYFEVLDTRPNRYFTGFIGAFEPGVIPGLTVGMTRTFVHYIPPEGLTAGDYFTAFQGITKQTQQTPENPTGDDEADQLLSIFGRWAFPASGVEVYVEWGRNDHAQDWTDFVLQPEHSQAVTAGLQKVFGEVEDRLLRVRAEITSLQRTQTHEDRPTPGWYRHHLVHHGYTHQGQVLGAGVGPGGNAQWLAVDALRRWGRIGGFAIREIADNDSYYRRRRAGLLTLRRNDVTLGGGLSGALLVGPVDVGLDLAALRRLHRDYVLDRRETNLHLALYTRWRLDGR
jgi:hypothetical protein